MKILKNIKVSILAMILLSFCTYSCEEADPKFEHSNNLISQMVCRASQTSSEFLGTIYEYDKNGVLLPDGFTAEQAEGGYGQIMFSIPMSFKDDVDLTRVFLIATLTYDEFITPSLYGRHDITGDGIVITVKSGIGTTRMYRIQGEYI